MEDLLVKLGNTYSFYCLMNNEQVQSFQERE